MILFYILSIIVLLFLNQYNSIPSSQLKCFLKGSYRVIGDDKQLFRVRQVPGDGGCLFHAISAWISYLHTDSHLDFDWRLRNLSKKLRHLAVHILQQNQTLVLENGESIDSYSLLEMVSEHYNMTSTDYCEQMSNPRTWGGGPEIVALSNHFRCPIHVYQLSATGKGGGVLFSKPIFSFELCAKFGSPQFDNKTTIYLLCADGRFPHIKPGKQKKVGDHFLAIFPSSSSGDHSATTQKIGYSTCSSGSGSMEYKCPIDITSCPEIRNDLLNLPDLLLSQLQQQQQQSEEEKLNVDVHSSPATSNNSKTKINCGGKSDKHHSSTVDTPPPMIPATKDKEHDTLCGGGFNMNELDKQYYAAIRSHPQYRKQRKIQFFRWLSKYEE